ncbi:intercellular adhesion molecule 4 [Struthio camelus]|uniref:intercellular adhesion molecule 4 n=1 Tax=Struthio camelus TaxID=8801 RepID=UPI003603B615
MGLLPTWCTMALLCLLSPGGSPSPCRVAIWPEEPAVELGSAIVLNCTSSCRNYSQLSWEVSVQKLLEQGPGWVSLSIPNVSDWRLDLQCFGVFGKKRDITTTTLYAYRFSPPRIYLGDEMVAGRETHIACNLSSPVPLSAGPLDLNLTLSAGGRPLSASHGRLALLHGFTARPALDGEEVTCQALLQLGRRRLSASAAAVLRVWAAPYNVCVSATLTTFAAGDNFTVTCRAEGSPPPRLRWELPSNASLELSAGGATATVRAAQSRHNGTYRCLASNRYGASSARVDVLFRASARSPLVPVAVGLAVAVALATVAGLWYLSRSRGWRPMQAGGNPS